MAIIATVVSIPKWYDLKLLFDGIQLLIDARFNSKMVRFKGKGVVLGRSKWLFQFQNGTI